MYLAEKNSLFNRSAWFSSLPRLPLPVSELASVAIDLSSSLVNASPPLSANCFSRRSLAIPNLADCENEVNASV